MTFEETVRKTYADNLTLAVEELDSLYESPEAKSLAIDWTVDDLIQKMYKIIGIR